MSLATALGIFTMPSFVFPAAGLGLWVVSTMLVGRVGVRLAMPRFVLQFGAMTAILALFFYTPVILLNNGFGTLLNNRFVVSEPFPVFFAMFPTHVSDTFSRFVRDVPFPLLGTMLLLIGTGFWFCGKNKNWNAALLLPCLIFGAALPLVIQHRIPFARTWIFALPFLFVLIDAGALACSEWLPSRVRGFERCALFVAVGVFGVSLMNRDVIASYPDTGVCADAEPVATFLAGKVSSGDELVVDCPCDSPLQFYLQKKGVSFDWRKDAELTSRERFVVRQAHYCSGAEPEIDGAERVFSSGDVTVYVFRGIADSTRIGYRLARQGHPKRTL